MSLPEFPYHQNPIATGSIKEADVICICCNKARGYVYVGPVYATAELDERICPWCIADGSAHDTFDCVFTDEAGIGGEHPYNKVSEEVIAMVAHRTPGFSGWQQERWWTHCQDAGQFLGRAGAREVSALKPDEQDQFRFECEMRHGEEWEFFRDALDAEGSPCAYLFKCRKCGAIGGYADFD